MTTHVYRYAWMPVNVPTAINIFIDPNFPATLVRQWSTALFDVLADDSTKSDLDDVLAKEGFMFVGMDLPPPPMPGDNLRGQRALVGQNQGARQLNQSAATAFYAAGQPTDLTFVTPSVAWGGGGAHPAGTYVAVVDASVVGAPVIVLDKTTGAVVANLPAPPLAEGAGWNRIAYVGGSSTPSNEKVVIRNSTTGLVDMVDLVAGTEFGGSTTVAAGGSHLYYDGGGLYLVGGDGALYFVNIPATSGVGGGFTQVQPPGTFDTNTQYMLSDGQFLYIPQPTNNQIAKVGPNYFQVGAPVSFFTDFGGAVAPQNPTGIAYDGRFLWISLPGQALLLQLDPTTPKLRSLRTQTSGNTGNGQHAVVWDGDSLWVTLSTQANPGLPGVSRVDPERSFSVGSGELGLFDGFNNATEIIARPTPAGAWLYVLSTGDNAVRLIKNEPLA